MRFVLLGDGKQRAAPRAVAARACPAVEFLRPAARRSVLGRARGRRRAGAERGHDGRRDVGAQQAHLVLQRRPAGRRRHVGAQRGRRRDPSIGRRRARRPGRPEDLLDAVRRIAEDPRAPRPGQRRPRLRRASTSAPPPHTAPTSAGWRASRPPGPAPEGNAMTDPLAGWQIGRPLPRDARVFVAGSRGRRSVAAPARRGLHRRRRGALGAARPARPRPPPRASSPQTRPAVVDRRRGPGRRHPGQRRRARSSSSATTCASRPT